VDLEDEVRTLAELVDHLELERFDMFALSCAGPPAIAYAAANSERVERLVLFGSFVRGSDVGPPSVKGAIQALVEYLASLTPYRHGDGFEVPAEFVCVAARGPIA
jgi:pimeloyl-ACP methyl ester carboxylesterase